MKLWIVTLMSSTYDHSLNLLTALVNSHAQITFYQTLNYLQYMETFYIHFMYNVYIYILYTFYVQCTFALSHPSTGLSHYTLIHTYLHSQLGCQVLARGTEAARFGSKVLALLIHKTGTFSCHIDLQIYYTDRTWAGVPYAKAFFWWALAHGVVFVTCFPLFP